MTIAIIILSVYLLSISWHYSLYFFDDYPLTIRNVGAFLFICITLPIWTIYLWGIQIGRFAKKLWKKCRKLLTRHK